MVPTLPYSAPAQDAEYVYKIAEQHGMVVWVHPQKTKFFVSEDGYPRLKEIMNKKKQQQQQQHSQMYTMPRVL